MNRNTSLESTFQSMHHGTTFRSILLYIASNESFFKPTYRVYYEDLVFDEPSQQFGEELSIQINSSERILADLFFEHTMLTITICRTLYQVDTRMHVGALVSPHSDFAFAAFLRFLSMVSGIPLYFEAIPVERQDFYIGDVHIVIDGRREPMVNIRMSRGTGFDLSALHKLIREGNSYIDYF